MRPVRIPALALLIALACLSSGCFVITLQPVYDDASLVADDALPGTWQGQEPAATVVIGPGEWKAYRITYTARTTSYAFVGYLTKIGDAVLLDLTPAHGLEADPLTVPAHGICRLQREGDTLTLAPLDYDWFTAALRARKLAPLDAAVDGRQNLLVTSKTAVVRAWLLAHLKNADVFREPVTLTRSR